MEKETTMNVSKSNLIWLRTIKDRLDLKSYDEALSKIKQIFKNLKLEREF